MFAQIYVPVCDWCAELEYEGLLWWLRGCWQWDCPPITGAFAMGVAIAAYVGLQLWAASRQPKA